MVFNSFQRRCAVSSFSLNKEVSIADNIASALGLTIRSHCVNFCELQVNNNWFECSLSCVFKLWLLKSLVSVGCTEERHLEGLNDRKLFQNSSKSFWLNKFLSPSFYLACSFLGDQNGTFYKKYHRIYQIL